MSEPRPEASRPEFSRPEFSRIVPLARLGFEPFRQEIAASEAECAALARRFDLIALDKLSATIELLRQGHDAILLRAAFEAEFVQSCVVTFEPVPGAVMAEFALRYGPPEAEESLTASADEDIAFEPLTGDAIDIGEAVAQEFSLALPPFPRCPDAAIEIGEEEPAPAGSFAALARLRKPESC